MARQRKRGTASGSLMLAFSLLPLVFMVSQSTETGVGPGTVLFMLFGALELPSIGWQLFILDSSQSDSTAFLSSIDT